MLASPVLSTALRLLPFVGLLAAALPSQQSFGSALELSRRGPALPPFNPDPSPNLPLLSFDAGGNFKVAIVTDTHLLDGQNNSQILADQSEAAVRTYLVQENPNFVVHLGDLISGEAANNTRDVENGVVQILRPMSDARIPFSTTKGNHDNDVYSTHSSITDLEHKHFPRQSYTRKAPKGVGESVGYGQEGTGTDTYWLGVYGNEKAKRGSRPELLLWFLDSRSGKTLRKFNNTGIEDWIHESVAPVSTLCDRARNRSTKSDQSWYPSGSSQRPQA
jgi:Calcineurin-like phosphoesterase